MRSRSWMTAFGLLAMLMPLGSAAADEPGGPAGEDEPPSVLNRVDLALQLSGIAGAGCKIEIKPAHPACRFEPVVKELDEVPADGVLRLDPIPIVAASLSADRDCAFAITIKAPDLEDQTFKRSIRLLPPEQDRPVPVRPMTCYLRTEAVAKREPPR